MMLATYGNVRLPTNLAILDPVACRLSIEEHS